jgi:hypothetical protein
MLPQRRSKVGSRDYIDRMHLDSYTLPRALTESSSGVPPKRRCSSNGSVPM